MVYVNAAKWSFTELKKNTHTLVSPLERCNSRRQVEMKLFKEEGVRWNSIEKGSELDKMKQINPADSKGMLYEFLPHHECRPTG